MAILKPIWEAAARKFRGSGYEDMLASTIKRAELSAPVAQRIVSVPVEQTAKRNSVIRDLTYSIGTPEAIGRRHGPVIQGVVESTQRQAGRAARTRAVSVDTYLTEASTIGIKEKSAQADAAAYVLNMIPNSMLEGEKALTNAELRKRLLALADGTGPLDDIFHLGRYADPLESDMTALSGLAGFMERSLTDQQFDWIRKGAKNFREVREESKAVAREMASARGVTDKEEIAEFVKRLVGEDELAYLPNIRIKNLAQLAHGGDPLTRHVPELQNAYDKELEALGKIWGIEGSEESLAAGLEELGKAARDAGGGKFRFVDPKSLGLGEKTYESVTDATIDLFNLAKVGVPLEEAQARSVRQNVGEILGNLKRIIDLPANKRGGIVGTVTAIPEKMRNRFFETRTFANRPWVRDFHGAYKASMDLSLKFNYVQPLLEEHLPLLRQLKETDDDLFKVVSSFMDDALGISSRISIPGLQKAGAPIGWAYSSTLLGNLSAATSNWLGQPGFLLAEQRIRPTLAAIFALVSRKGKFSPLLEILEAEHIGIEGMFSGTGNVREAFHALRKSKTPQEAFARAKQFGLRAVDVFGQSERSLQKVAFLSGMIRHLEKTGRWNPSMTPAQLESTYRSLLHEAPDELANAGYQAIAKGTFLFGNLNQPALLRQIKKIPGVGQATAMFTNYPVQATARLTMWVHDAGRMLKHGPGDAQAMEAIGKLTRFFSYGTLIAGPFFMAPFLRDLEPSMDDSSLSRLKDLFVSWEKNGSFAGAIGHAMEMATGEFETPELATKLSPLPSGMNPAGLPGEVFSPGPVLGLAAEVGTAIAGRSPEAKAAARRRVLGGWLDSVTGGEGDPSRPAPSGGIALLIPGGIALARIVNFTSTVNNQGIKVDSLGRLTGPPSTLSREIVRFFGRPLGEVLEGTEGRIAAQEGRDRTGDLGRIKSAVLDRNMALVGEMIATDPSLIEALDARDIRQAAQARNLVPQARAMLHKPTVLMIKELRRAGRRLSSGELTPSEEYTAKQILAVGSLRLRKLQAKGSLNRL